MRTNSTLLPVDLHHVSDWHIRARLARYRVKEFVLVCGVNRRRLERFFKAHYGVPPQRWLNICRQKDLETLLKETQLVKEAAYAAGYKQPSHLSRQFRAAHGMSPSSWRLR